MTNATILIIDDDVDLRGLLDFYLGELLGYHILQASDGLAGLHHIREKKPDLVMLDMNMPGLTGLDTLMTLRDMNYTVPVIFMTASHSEQIIIDAFRLGVYDYLRKPLDQKAVQYTVERVLREKNLAREKEVLSQQVLQAETTRNTVVTLAHHINNQLQIASSAVSIVQEKFEADCDLKKRGNLQKTLQTCDDSLAYIAAVLRVLQRVTAVHLTDYDAQTPMIDIAAALRTELKQIPQ